MGCVIPASWLGAGGQCWGAASEEDVGMQLLGSRSSILVVSTSIWPVVLTETVRDQRIDTPEVIYNYFYD